MSDLICDVVKYCVWSCDYYYYYYYKWKVKV